MAPKRKKVLRWLWRSIGILLSVLLFVFLYLTLIVGQPQKTDTPSLPPQPALTASPSLNITAETDLLSLISSFPAPVMSFMSGSGMTFVSATSADAAWQDGFGRIATLYWQTAEGHPMILQSIYPAAALDLMGRQDYSFSNIAGPTLFGRSSVRMENAETIRLHTVTEAGIYVVTAPLVLSDSLAVLSRSIQLFTVESGSANR